MPLGSTIDDVGRVDEDVAVGVVALELHQVHRVAVPRSLCGSSALARPGRLSPSFGERVRPWALDAGDVLHWLESVAAGTAGVVRLAVGT